MSRLTLTLPLLLVGLPALAQDPIPWANKFFSGKAEAPPPVILHDFGTLPKGTVKTYRFQMTNIYAFPMQLHEPKPTCGCVSVVEYTGKMNPRDTGHIDIKLDTSRVEGPKKVKLPVTFYGRDPKTDEPFYSTAQLEIQTDSRPDIAIHPGSAVFGTVPVGKKAVQQVTLVYSGSQRGWKVTEVGYKKELFEVAVAPVEAPRGSRAAYQLTVTLKETAPAGAFDEQIVLRTNDREASASALNLTATGTVQAALSVFGPDRDGRLNLGKVAVGKEASQNIIIRAENAFTVTAVEGQGDGLKVPLIRGTAGKSIPLTVVFAPEKVGPIKKVLTIKTDTGDSVSFTVEATAIE
jgi:Protein of unknown function (DUF1573)